MYQTKITGNRLYHTVSEGYGDSVTLFGKTDQGETPMSLLVIALSSCVTMCVQGFYHRQFQQDTLAVSVEASYEEEAFELLVRIDDVLDDKKKADLLAYIGTYCRVKRLLKPEVMVTIMLEGLSHD
ncbi:OsmC family protein [Streptococcus pyogenes]|uniref:OsmC family protein n=1 Tax=Streptococcus pyogenes TaxID=1314 RepID=UPI00109BB8E2|nr:OsmC family protein [Streptococcus pyogenes]VGR54296.1 salt-stress induced protein [Streptococcus pyogenes]VGR86869.1 salt-stress induced protein [Streptococcus pyogenes]VGV63401.1 salt-stress induced protein [Streptococcus pyogenes]VGY26551.1 salt-stress induced protein [Streptococcus pyogenes]VHC76704.1 salt-stress induced protein [Streptococcus pyogenes]